MNPTCFALIPIDHLGDDQQIFVDTTYFNLYRSLGLLLAGESCRDLPVAS
jgi:hypothetical protein